MKGKKKEGEFALMTVRNSNEPNFLKKKKNRHLTAACVVFYTTARFAFVLNIYHERIFKN